MFSSSSCGCLARTRTRKCGTKNRCVTITLQGNPMSTGQHAVQIAVQNYCFFLNCNLFIAIFCDTGRKSLDNEQIIVLLTLLGQDVLVVEQHVDAGGHVGVSKFLLVDAHATTLCHLAHLTLAWEYCGIVGE